jgi:hypothetical protein
VLKIVLLHTNVMTWYVLQYPLLEQLLT